MSDFLYIFNSLIIVHIIMLPGPSPVLCMIGEKNISIIILQLLRTMLCKFCDRINDHMIYRAWYKVIAAINGNMCGLCIIIFVNRHKSFNYTYIIYNCRGLCS